MQALSRHSVQLARFECPKAQGALHAQTGLLYKVSDNLCPYGCGGTVPKERTAMLLEPSVRTPSVVTVKADNPDLGRKGENLQLQVTFTARTQE